MDWGPFSVHMCHNSCDTDGAFFVIFRVRFSPKYYFVLTNKLLGPLQSARLLCIMFGLFLLYFLTLKFYGKWDHKHMKSTKAEA